MSTKWIEKLKFRIEKSLISKVGGPSKRPAETFSIVIPMKIGIFSSIVENVVEIPIARGKRIGLAGLRRIK